MAGSSDAMKTAADFGRIGLMAGGATGNALIAGGLGAAGAVAGGIYGSKKKNPRDGAKRGGPY